MTPKELMDVRDLLQCFRAKQLTGKLYDRIVEAERVVQRDINLQTTDYVKGTRIPIFKDEDRIRDFYEHEGKP